MQIVLSGNGKIAVNAANVIAFQVSHDEVIAYDTCRDDDYISLISFEGEWFAMQTLGDLLGWLASGESGIYHMGKGRVKGEMQDE